MTQRLTLETTSVTCAAVGVLLIEELAALSRALPGGDSLPRQIANAHVAFNVLGVAAFLPFTAKIARLLERSLPDKPAATEHARGVTSLDRLVSRCPQAVAQRR